VSPEETVPEEKVISSWRRLANRLELLERRRGTLHLPNSWRSAAKACTTWLLQVPDLASVVARLRSDGVRMVSDEINECAGGHRYIFVHPSSAGGAS